MNKIELEFADYLVNMLREISPKVEGADWYDLESGEKIEKLNEKQINEIVDVLVAQKWILKYKDTYLYTFNKEIIPTIKKYGSFSNFYLQNEIILKRREQKEIFDFQTAKWKYYTFWLWFALAVFGGGYSTYDFIKRLSTKESDQQSQTHTTKTESEESKSHISTSDHENPHSFQDSTTVVF